MRTKDEELYYACIDFCQAMGSYLFRKDEYNNREVYRELDFLDARMDYEEEKVRHYFAILKEKIDEIDNRKWQKNDKI